VVSDDHPLVLLGPWYRWAAQQRPPRATRPALQKYAGTDAVMAFLRDPQRSLKFVDEDHVATLEPRDPDPGPPPKLPRRFSGVRRVSTETRKLFLDIHRRFYLVVCELHCDAPGLPNAARDHVCEAGFVIRRRRRGIPQPARREAAARMRRITARRTQLARLDRLAPGTRVGVRVRAGETIAERRATLLTALTEEREELARFAEAVGAVETVQGWLPSAADGFGAWQGVAEEPDTLSESVVPLTPLIPDPRDRQHSGAGRTIYFGLVPTASADAEPDGTARFDDHSLYEVRCFARRHQPQCPRTPDRGDCRGELIWSAPTELYQLAAPFDLDGTAHRPVTVTLPDLPALTAQAAALPPGPSEELARIAPFKVVAPAGSGLNFKVRGGMPVPGSPPLIGPAFCHFAIPLVTIVAMFVFRLFLPIVVLLFGLWPLLKLRFCVPPSFTVEATVTAELAGRTDAELLAPPAALQQQMTKLKLQLDDELGTDADNRGVGRGLLGPPPQFGADAIVGMVASVTADLAASGPPNVPPGERPLRVTPWDGGDLVYEDRVNPP
jgi:hypothetical protein